jgi:hypothetical protein
VLIPGELGTFRGSLEGAALMLGDVRKKPDTGSKVVAVSGRG